MIYSIFAILINLFCLTAHSATAEGFVRILNNQAHIVTKADKNTYLLSGQTPAISIYINRLSDGDYVSVEAGISVKSGIMNVAYFHYVGLKSLIGTWVGDDTYCYSFTSFNEFAITQKRDKKCLNTIISKYVYTINPSNNAWVILVSSDTDSFVGDISPLITQDFELKLYDSSSGDIVRNLKLKKLTN
jgi:hypothetical protein